MSRKKGKISIDVNDIIGMQSGKLKVVKYYGFAYTNTKGGDRLRHYYYCECECGGSCIVQRGNLKNKTTRSCSCARRKKHGN